MNFSLTIAGVIAMALATLAKAINYELPYTQEALSESIYNLLQIIGLITAYIGRVRLGDITWYGKKIERLVPLSSVPHIVKNNE